MSQLGLKLRQIREEKKLTQLDVSKRTGLSLSSIAGMESGKKLKRASIVRIAEKLRVTPDVRTELLLLWLRADMGDKDFALVNPMPSAPPRPAPSSPAHRLMDAASQLTPSLVEEFILACHRPAVCAGVVALNKLHDQVIAQR
jgi:transcriptional regulator with XRE-family HTH domain